MDDPPILLLPEGLSARAGRDGAHLQELQGRPRRGLSAGVLADTGDEEGDLATGIGRDLDAGVLRRAKMLAVRVQHLLHQFLMQPEGFALGEERGTNNHFITARGFINDTTKGNFCMETLHLR